MVAFGALKSGFAAGAARGAGSLGGKFLGGQMDVPDLNSRYAKAINETNKGNQVEVIIRNQTPGKIKKILFKPEK